jgi:hypothetical protein
MHFFRDCGATDFCSCTKSRRFRRNRYTVHPVHKRRASAPVFGSCLRFAPNPCTYCHGWHVCRLRLKRLLLVQEQKPATKKSLFLGTPLSRYAYSDKDNSRQ